MAQEFPISLQDMRSPTAGFPTLLHREKGGGAQLNFFQEILDQLQQGLAAFDARHTLILCNRLFLEILTLPKEYEGIGLRLETLLAYCFRHSTIRFEQNRDAQMRSDRDPIPLESKTAEAWIQEVMRGKEKSFLIHFDRSKRVVDLRLQPLPQGRILLVCTNVTQSSEEKKTFSTTQKILESRVKTRTKRLMLLNQALIHAKKKAEEANLSRTRFFAAAGHDIAQLLGATTLYAGALMNRLPKGEPNTLLKNLKTSLSLVQETLRDVLQISYLDAGKFQPKCNAFPLAPLFEALSSTFSQLAKENGLRLIFVPSSEWVFSDRHLLQRVLQNLLSNALKYTPPSGRVLIGCRRVGATLRIDICDTGIGIAAEDHERIFQEFHRLEDGQRLATGAGLGLSIVRRIARLLDHPLTVNSETQKGSRFSLTLPRASSERRPDSMR